MIASTRFASSRSTQRGFLLPWALALLVLVGGTSAVLVSRMATMRQAAATDEVDVQAVLSADGALATARALLATDPLWAGGKAEIGGVTTTTRVVREPAGWRVDVHAGGGVVVEAHLRGDGREEGRVPRIASWRRVR